MHDITDSAIFVCPRCGRSYIGNSWDVFGDMDDNNQDPFCPVDGSILELDTETVL